VKPPEKELVDDSFWFEEAESVSETLFLIRIG
jgi:hypothetical protein